MWRYGVYSNLWTEQVGDSLLGKEPLDILS